MYLSVEVKYIRKSAWYDASVDEPFRSASDRKRLSTSSLKKTNNGESTICFINYYFFINLNNAMCCGNASVLCNDRSKM